MAERTSTVRVSGLPTDLSEDRLTDKLLVHFLRARNGGGEVRSVTVVPAAPASALIVFEESEVAHRVVQQSRHVLEVDGKRHPLTVAVDHANLDPDKVVLDLTATVDYSQFPEGTLALTGLSKSHPDVQIKYDADGLCAVSGAYSKVQAALTHLLGRAVGQQRVDKRSGQPDPADSRVAQTPFTQGPENQRRKPPKKKEQWLPDEEHTGSHRDLTPPGCGGQVTGQAEATGLQLPNPSTKPEEDFSMIVDADMYRYLMKNSLKEYHFLLSQYGAEVLDKTTEGLTTLVLQVPAAANESGQQQQRRLEMAQKAVSQLFQENENMIRRVKVPKDILPQWGGLQRAKENLNLHIPKLLLDEDERNIYVIGSIREVSEAQRMLLLDHDKVRVGKETVGSLLKYTTQDLSPPAEVRVSSAEGRLDNGLDPLQRSDEDERGGEGARRRKLAARFKDPRLPTLASLPADFSTRAAGTSSRPARPGPMLGHNVLSEAAGISGESFPRAESQNTGDDILFKSGDYSHSVTQNKSPPTSNVTDNQASADKSSLPERNMLPPAGSGPTLKRASSFSGTPQQKITSQRSHEDPGNPTVRSRVRSSSFSSSKRSDGVHHAKITVSSILWEYIKGVYRTQLDNLLSDVKVKDKHSEGGIDISGTDQSKVNACKTDIQMLVDSVGVNFSVIELQLSDLGVSDPADETLLACCAEVSSRSKKVTIQVLNSSLFILGPQETCSKVAATLHEVFTGDSAQMFKQDLHSPLNSHGESPVNGGQSMVPHLDAEGGRKSDVSETEPSLRKDPVFKEKLKAPSTVEMDGQKTDAPANSLASGNDRHLIRANGVGSASEVARKKEKSPRVAALKDNGQLRHGEVLDIPLESRPGQGSARRDICACGNNGVTVEQTKCGLAMCSMCLTVMHGRCRVCDDSDLVPRGIRGTMSHNKLNFSVPGHTKDLAIKITYCIPDGIQGDNDLSPGTPFQGGVFEAFLPDCQAARRLLPRLEKAFELGLTFMVTYEDSQAKVTWHCIPHKTSLHGGKRNGYPDSMYLTRLSEILTSHRI